MLHDIFDIYDIVAEEFFLKLNLSTNIDYNEIIWWMIDCVTFSYFDKKNILWYTVKNHIDFIDKKKLNIEITDYSKLLEPLSENEIKTIIKNSFFSAKEKAIFELEKEVLRAKVALQKFGIDAKTLLIDTSWNKVIKKEFLDLKVEFKKDGSPIILSSFNFGRFFTLTTRENSEENHSIIFPSD